MKGIVIRLALIGAVALGAFVLRDRLSASAGDLRVGDCFDLKQAETVEDVQHHPCGEPHDAEVVFVGDYPAADDAPPPSVSDFDSFVTKSCESAGVSYVGGTAAVEQLNLGMGYFYPEPDGWTHGDHEVICYLAESAGTKLTKSVKAT